MFRVVSDYGNPVAFSPQAPLFMEFLGPEYWSGFPFPSPGDLPNPGINITSSALAGRFLITEPPGKPIVIVIVGLILNIKTDRVSHG